MYICVYAVVFPAGVLFQLYTHVVSRICICMYDIRELRFGLLKQRLLELVRLGDADAALNFAAERLAPEGARDPAMLRQIEEALTLLAYEVRRTCTRSGWSCFFVFLLWW